MPIRAIQSFRTKLIMLVILSSTLAAVLVGGVLLVRDFTEFLNLSLQHLESQADLTAIHSAAPMAFHRPDEAGTTLAALHAISRIGAAFLYDAEGNRFASYLRAPWKDEDLPKVDPLVPSRQRIGDWLVVSGRPVIQEGEDEQLGTLTMIYDVAPIYSMVRNGVAVSIGLMALALTASLSIALLLNRSLTRPLVELDRTARTIARTKNYAVRATVSGRDELAQLTTVFNEMLEQVAAKEADVVSARERFRTAVEGSPNAMIMVDRSGRIVMVNTRTEEFFGYSRDELVKMNVDGLVPERFRDGHEEYREGFMRTPAARPMGSGRDLYGLRKDGTEFPVEIGLNPIHTDEGLMVLGTVVDITERKRIEQQRNELLDSERAARTEAERASRMKDEFVATLSHELRTPLTAILGWAQMLSRGGMSNEDTAQGLAIIERNARLQTQLIEDLLDMSRIVSGKVRLDVQLVELPDVIDAALSTIEPAATAKEIRLQKVIDPRVTPVHGDPGRLQQVVWNLLSNAVKFTHRGGRIQVSLQRINSHVEIIISDTGEGISHEFLPHIFERFRQQDPTTTRTHGGLGLGLAIVKQLVELHGGTIHASSPGENQGATFTIKLPLAIIHPHEEPDRVHPKGSRISAVAAGAAGARSHANGGPHSSHGSQGYQSPLSLSGVRVLIVEDEADARELICRVLEQRDAKVLSTGSADEALATLDAFQPDVLISDIGMPGKDGYDFIREVRKRGPQRGGSTPAIALTAFARTEDRTRSLIAGYQMHVAKPVEPSELIASVASMAGMTRRSSGGETRRLSDGEEKNH